MNKTLQNGCSLPQCLLVAWFCVIMRTEISRTKKGNHSSWGGKTLYAVWSACLLGGFTRSEQRCYLAIAHGSSHVPPSSEPPQYLPAPPKQIRCPHSWEYPMMPNMRPISNRQHVKTKHPTRSCTHPCSDNTEKSEMNILWENISKIWGTCVSFLTKARKTLTSMGKGASPENLVPRKAKWEALDRQGQQFRAIQFCNLQTSFYVQIYCSKRNTKSAHFQKSQRLKSRNADYR